MKTQVKSALLKFSVGLFIFLFAMSSLKAQPEKIQQSIDAIKAAYYSEQDYHTDGQRIVWVKSYKKWTPDDLPILKKEALDVVQFLTQAIQHNRLDVLQQLLPTYYVTKGGVKKFAEDIMNISKTAPSPSN